MGHSARRHGLLEPHEAEHMLTWDHRGGFGLDASVRIEATDREGPKRLIGFIPSGIHLVDGGSRLLRQESFTVVDPHLPKRQVQVDPPSLHRRFIEEGRKEWRQDSSRVSRSLTYRIRPSSPL